NTRPENTAAVTVVTVFWMPAVVVSPSLIELKAVPVWLPVNASPAWLATVEPVGDGEPIVTPQRTLVATPGASDPPDAQPAPVPRRATMLREAATYSA